MNKSDFIRKWLANSGTEYTEHFRDEMHKDLVLIGDNPKKYFPEKEFMEEIAQGLATDLSFNMEYRKLIAEKILDGMNIVLNATYGEYYGELRACFQDKMGEWAKSIQHLDPEVLEMIHNEFWNLLENGKEAQAQTR